MVCLGGTVIIMSSRWSFLSLDANHFANKTHLGLIQHNILWPDLDGMLGTLALSPTMDLGGGSKSKPRMTHRPSQPTQDLPDSELGPVTRAAVSLEYAGLRNKDHCPLGMYVVPSNDNLLLWDCVFFVHQGK